jgi:hypothetical protein
MSEFLGGERGPCTEQSDHISPDSDTPQQQHLEWDDGDENFEDLAADEPADDLDLDDEHLRDLAGDWRPDPDLELGRGPGHEQPGNGPPAPGEAQQPQPEARPGDQTSGPGGSPDTEQRVAPLSLEQLANRQVAPEFEPPKETSDPGSWDGPVTVASGTDSGAAAGTTGDADTTVAGDTNEPERPEAVQAARGQVAAAYDGAEQTGTASVSSPAEFDAKAAAAMETGTGDQGQDVSAPAAQLGDAPRAMVDVPDTREQQVIDDAKAGLAERENAGDVLGGDPVGRAELWHEQGRNDLGYKSDCALACSAQVLQDSGVRVSENDVVNYAARNHLCETRESELADNGGARLDAVQRILSDHGVASHLQGLQQLEQLARSVEDGHGVIQAVNSDMLWDGELNPDSAMTLDFEPLPDHAVVVTGTVRDPQGRLDGFVINDTGDPGGPGVQVDLERWQDSIELELGGCVVTDRPTDVERGVRG